jgi:hypothetical protein
LIVKTAEKAWLPPLRDKLVKAMTPVIGTWGKYSRPVDVFVSNESGARKKRIHCGSLGLSDTGSTVVLISNKAPQI